jgi:hypothetical protein
VRLIVLHRILVSAAIAFCGLMVWVEVRRFLREGGAVALLVAGACLVAGVVLAWYLANLRRFVHLDPVER